MTNCEICEELGASNCHNCRFGNPCLGCHDYDFDNDICKSDGACGKDEVKE